MLERYKNFKNHLDNWHWLSSCFCWKQFKYSTKRCLISMMITWHCVCVFIENNSPLQEQSLNNHPSVRYSTYYFRRYFILGAAMYVHHATGISNFIAPYFMSEKLTAMKKVLFFSGLPRLKHSILPPTGFGINNVWIGKPELLDLPQLMEFKDFGDVFRKAQPRILPVLGQ